MTAKTIVKCVCMYCGLHYADRDGRGTSGVSHGICPVCEAAEKCILCGWPVASCECETRLP